jgi:hypothetical protein
MPTFEGDGAMSTLVTSVRNSVAGHWLLTAFAAAVAIAALVTALVVTLAANSSGTSKDTSPTIGQVTPLPHNGYCNAGGISVFHGC